MTGRPVKLKLILALPIPVDSRVRCAEMTPVEERPSAGEVRLRDVEEGDLPILFEHQKDPEANRMAAFSARDWDAFMAHWAGVLRDGTVVKKTVLVDDRVAGNIVCFGAVGEREVGYWIGRGYWGKGVATRALAEFLRLVPARPLHAYVAKHNLASVRVLERCGFTTAREDRFSSRGGEDVEGSLLVLEG